MLGWIMAAASLSACASHYAVSTYPVGAKVKVENIISKEVFDIGEGPTKFEHEDRFGDGFVMIVEKEQFAPKRIYLSKNSGGEMTIQVNLEPAKAADAGDKDNADDKNDKNQKKDPEQDKKDGKEIDKRLAVLERTFEVYKDALFSQRYGAGPASYDRDRVDTSVTLVSKAQQLIEQRKLDDAMAVVDKMLTKDEYLVQGHILKGSIDYLRGDMDKAVVAWQRALEINPYDRLTRQYLVNAYRKLGKQLPENIDEIEAVDRTPAGATSPLQPDPLRLKLRERGSSR